MEKSNCLMLTVTLETGIDLDAVFKEEDLVDSGVQYDHHITIFYEEGDKIYGDFTEDCKQFLGKSEFDTFQEFLNGDDLFFPTMEEFDLSCFENSEYDVVILELKDNEIKRVLNKLNKGFSEKYNIQSDYPIYTPHVTLAYVKKGLGKKYLESQLLKLVLKPSQIRFDDLFISYGIDDNYNQIAITNYHTLERHFRLENIKREQLRNEKR